MSRPDDTNSHNAGTAQAGHPTGWPRPQEQHARDPITGRPLATQPAEAWQGSQAYHYPGQAGHTPAAPYPPAGTAQHYQPAAPAAQPQPGLRGGAVQPDYAPQFARYSGGEAAPIQPGYAADPYQPPRAPAAQPEGWPPAASQHAQAYVPAPGHAGTESHWPGDRLPYQNLTTGEPRSYDPNAYATPAQAYPDPHAGYPPQAYQGGFQEAGYQQGAPGQFGQGQPSHSQSSHGHYPAEQGYDPHTGQPYAPGAFGQAEAYQGYAPHDGAFDAGQPIAGNEAGYDGDYAEAPPRKRRGLLVAGALVCAVAIGGGLAFVYKTFGQGGKRIGAPPLVAKASTPAKVAPTDPQGKQFENTNKKVMAKLENAGGAASSALGAGAAPVVPGMIVSMPPTANPAASAPPAAETGPPATRTVQTVPIGRDGNPVGGQPAVVTPRGLPGVQVDHSLNAPPAMRGGIPAADAPPPPPAPAAKAQAQRLAATPQAPVERIEAIGAPEQPVARPKPRIAKAPKEALTPASGPAAPAVPSAAASALGSGYVAVLSSQKDKAAALRIYADLAQKYPDQLGSRQPEVQEANVPEKGVFQRLVVGPPSSQQSARELCTQLKAAGYPSDCWVKQY